jgi:hypothetical protein
MWKTYPPQLVVLNFQLNILYTVNFTDVLKRSIPVPVQNGFTIYTVQSANTEATFITNLPTSLTNVIYLIVAGGGGGGGGGGAGGVIYSSGLTFNPETSYTLTVGTGGAGTPYETPGTNGTDSILCLENNSITATGGGGGGSGFSPNNNGKDGGSGGGAGEDGDSGGGSGGNGIHGQGNSGAPLQDI